MKHDITAFHPFKNLPEDIRLPELFTYPFRYEPHPIAIKAAQEVQHYIGSMAEWQEELEKGKMFGVLVVQKEGQTGFLAAYSGILDGRNDHDYFVPPVYDLLQPEGFFKKEERRISDINLQIKRLEDGEERTSLLDRLARLSRESETELAETRRMMKMAKQQRDALRATSEEEKRNELIRESQYQKAEYKRLEKRWKAKVADAQTALQRIETAIQTLKEERKKRSCALQQQLFGQFRMLNARGETKDLCRIFMEWRQCVPPAGAGECAAPKLLQYAYLHGMHPLAMAEFWWGKSPKTEIRRHGNFYPACKSKCEPILSFMLQGLNVEPNPMMETARNADEPEIVYEDEWIVAINKPAGMYTVPGKDDVKSVYSWAKERYADRNCPFIVHRLDMDTSGLLLIAKTKEAHFQLQKLFENREIKKKYIAILNGTVQQNSGFIRLPLCPDSSDRPRQMVSETYGKPAITRFQVISRQHGQTRMAFYPQTGRTHQLRVHAAHPEGLNAPIVGDALYGIASERLYLHAEELAFKHFMTGKMLRLTVPAPF